MGFVDWLQGCTHRRKSFPMSPRHVGSRDGPLSRQPEVYVVCLDCGRRFAYDWNTMQIKKAQGSTPPLARNAGDFR
jgi:hypothetical protein